MKQAKQVKTDSYKSFLYFFRRRLIRLCIMVFWHTDFLFDFLCSITKAFEEHLRSAGQLPVEADTSVHLRYCRENPLQRAVW